MLAVFLGYSDIYVSDWSVNLQPISMPFIESVEWWLWSTKFAHKLMTIPSMVARFTN